LLKRPPPAASESVIEWSCGAWKAAGRWRENGGPIREILFDSPEGSLEWNCIAPRARAEVRAGGAEFCGWGYVEHLRLTVRPWRLPIRRLRWGRFASASDALVWIDWEGPYTRRVVYLNGAPVRAEANGINEGEVRLEGGIRLSLERPAALREGTLGSTALRVIPNMERVFPASARNITERKWLSDAKLQVPGRQDSTGKAIHEVVEWQ
jgi:hypothetical protein